MNPQLVSQIEMWRRKAIDGTLTAEEMREAVIALREGRKSASIASDAAKGKRKAASAPLPSGDDLLDEMLG